MNAMLKNTILKTTALLTLAAAATAAAKADSISPITITFDQPSQSAGPNGELEYFGTIYNNTGSTIFLNFDGLDETDATSNLTLNDQFFSIVPVSIDANSNSGDIELFDVSSAISGSYTGVYSLSGGADGNAADLLGATTFSATVTPEPSSLVLLLSGVGAAGAMIRRRRSIV